MGQATLIVVTMRYDVVFACVRPFVRDLVHLNTGQYASVFRLPFSDLYD